jgi:superfamily I DNA/RNA helicase
MQVRAVIVLWADKLPFNGRVEQRQDDRRLLYVAMTRAESFLAITASATSVFTNDVTNCPVVSVVDGQRRKFDEINILAG